MIEDAASALVVLTVIGSLFAAAALLEDRIELRWVHRLLAGDSATWHPPHTDKEARP